MPDNATIVTNFLKANPKQYFCVPCLMQATGVAPFAQVNQIVRPLEHAKDYRYLKTTCSACSRDLKCVGFFA